MDIPEEKNIYRLTLNEDAKANLSVLSQWMIVNAVIALVNVLISIGELIVALNKMYSISGEFFFSGPFFFFLFVTGISVLLNMVILVSAKNLKESLQQRDRSKFNKGLRKLNAYFRICAIAMILSLLAALLFVIFIVMAKISRG